MAVLNVGIIGCGTIATLRHAPEYAAREDVRIVATYDAYLKRAQDMAALYGANAYSNWEELIADDKIDAVSICTSNKWHAPIGIAALRAGKHVLCEKPMAVTLKEAEEMVIAAKESQKFLMIGHNQRLVPAHIRAKELLQDGELGRILSFETVFRHGGPENWGADKGVNTWFFQNDNALSGSLGDLGVHKMDLIRWLTGDEVDQVQCCMTTLDKVKDDGKLVDVNDNAICILSLKSGIVGTITTSWTCYGEEDNKTVIYCSNGIMKICDNPDYSIVVLKKNKEKTFYQVGKVQTNDSQTKSGVIDAFVDSILEGRKPEISGEEGIKVLKVLFACVESSKTGKKVKVESM